MEPRCSLEHSCADPVLNFCDSVPQLFRYCLTFESFDGVRMSRGGHDDKRDYCHGRPRLLELIVQASESLDEHIDTLVTIFISSCRKHIEGIFQVKVVMPVEMTSDKLVYFGPARCMKILELMHGLELDHVQTVWQDAIGFPL